METEAPRPFELPAALRDRGLSLRRETDADEPFLRRLYASTREDELAQVADWTPEQKAEFLAGQFQAQRRHYRTYRAACAFDVLEINGVPAGRLYVDARPHGLHVVDISLLPEWRRQGLGTALLQALQNAAAATGRQVSIFVEKFNPALELYRRLGFAAVNDHGVYLEMVWRADSAPDGASPDQLKSA